MTTRVVFMSEAFASQRYFLESIPRIMEQEGTVVQDGRNLIKVMTAPDGTKLNVKRYHRPHGINQMVYSLGLRRPKGARAFLHAGRLLKMGFSTPQPVVYMEERSHGMLGYSYFVSLQCPFGHKMYEWGNAAEGSYEQFAEAFGRYTASLHEAGILHRDYTPGNILWQQAADGHFEFALVDINQMRFGRITEAQGARNICKFWGPKRFIRLIAEAYAEARGFGKQAFTNRVMVCRRRFWKRYERRKPGKAKFNIEL